MICNSYQLQDVCTFIDYRGKTPPKTTSGVPLITAKIIKNGTILRPQEYIALDYYDEWMRRGIPKKGSVVFTTEAPLGEVAQIKTGERLAFAQRVIILEPNPNVLSPNYLLYALQDKVLQERIKARATGTTVIGIKAAELKKVVIDLPSVDIQRSISSILRSFDDKIELNQKINENSQKQAFTLFDRLLSAKHLSECRLSQIATINPKRILKKAKPARCIDMAQLSTSGSFPNGWEVKPYNGGMRFSNGDTLLARITPCLENGKTAYIDFLDENEVAFGSTEYVVITSQGEYPPEFFYCLARYPAFVDYAVKT
ncbi:restriction endonuclease subunit S [Oscillospiraceae bacterium 21-37]